MNKQLLGGLLVATALLATSPVLANTQSVPTARDVTVQNAVAQGDNLISTELDSLGRPLRARFVGNDAGQLGRRASKTPPDPINIKRWTNQKLEKNGYLWNRGHLIGDQFAGHASNVRENIVGETVWLNQTLMTYFEGGTKRNHDNALDNWLYLHPNYYIEYEVHVHWGADAENYPRSVTLRYRGVAQDGTPVEIRLPDLNAEGAGKQISEGDFWTSVRLENIQPGYDIDYVTGRATKKSGDATNQDLSQNQDLPAANGEGALVLKEMKPSGFERWLEQVIKKFLRDVIGG